MSVVGHREGTSMKVGLNRDERLEWEKQVLRDLIEDGGIKQRIISRWCSETAQQRSAFYLRVKDLSGDSKMRWDRLPDLRKLDRSILEDLEDSMGIVEYKAKKQGRKAAIADIRRWWENRYSDYPFNQYWEAIPRSERRVFEE